MMISLSMDIVKCKRFICDNVDMLTYDDKVQILNIIKRQNHKHIKSMADGSRINLDNLPQPVIVELHNFVKYKLGISD